MAKATRAAYKPADRSPIPPQHELDDSGISHSVTTQKSGGTVSGTDVKVDGLNDPQLAEVMDLCISCTGQYQ